MLRRDGHPAVHPRPVPVGITTAVSRIGAALGTFALPFGLAYWGVGPTMLVAAIMTAAGFLVRVFMAEETKGMKHVPRWDGGGR